MKRYQICLLFFAIIIFILTYYLGSNSKLNILSSSTPTAVEEWASIKVFFGSTKKDPQTLYCDVTYPIERWVLLKNDKGRLGELVYRVINELVKGPTEQEKAVGFFSSINTATKIREIKIENGIATVDFNEALEKGAAGSCMVQIIRSQITQTLKQFPEIKEVVISVEGESGEVLQP